MQDYINHISQLSNPSFQSIRSIAINSISHLSKEEHDELYYRLKRGVALLHTHEEMCQYLYSFGNMHQAKLLDAFNKLPNQLFEYPFEVIDWGCGQAMGTINLYDFLKGKGLDSNIKKITLIEPSVDALKRGVKHVSVYKGDDVIVNSISSFFEDIIPEQITSQTGLPQIHIFSNILDVAQIDLKHLANLIDSGLVSDNFLVCVGPLNAGNKRIDAFYNYFNFRSDFYCDFEDTQFEYGGYNTCTYKAKLYKLEYSEQGNLIPIEFYPSVQFHSSYQLDIVNAESKRNKDSNLKSIERKLNVFETSTPFDIGASVYDDVHPILAVLNNIVTRGLPTKASLNIENTFQQTFNYSVQKEKYGTIYYTPTQSFDFDKNLLWYNSIISDDTEVNYNSVNSVDLQLIFSPIAVARVQKTILEALMTDQLDLFTKEWKILVEEKDVPCAAIAFSDLAEMFNKLTKLSKDYQDLVFPEISLAIISNEQFFDSKLHLDHNALLKATPAQLKTQYDLVIDVAIFDTTNIEKESFSRFQCKNNCYFNIRSVTEINSERNIYTTDRIVYRDIVSQDGQGNYSDIDETKNLLEYFLQLIFRKKSFRPGQLPILNRALQNKSVIGLLPTGGGKSLTYQLASMLQPGVTLIVDPLRSLMKDQYDGLINVGIDTCAFVNSTLSKEERDEAERIMEQSRLLFVFLSPERLAIYKFREKLKNMHELNVYFSYGVIDEVHCVSEWGHDFRFSYLHLGRNLYNYVRAKKDEISLFGLTATASFDVLADVERELSGDGAFPLDSETIVRYENSNRLELQYKIEKVNVEFDDDPNYDKNKNIDSHLPRAVKISNKWGFFDAKQDFLINYIKIIPNYIKEIQSDKAIQSIKNTFSERQGNSIGVDTELKTNISQNYFSKNEEYSQAGIVFCPHVKGTGISVASNKETLQDLVPDVGTFSGGDDDDCSNSSMDNLELFRTNKQPIMIATKAFGMGIDKPNVRFTVNLNYSSSLESFVQEAGRGGRDRKMALSVILLSDYKLARISRKIQNGSFPLGLLKGRWFKPQDLQQIVNHYNLNIDEQYLDYLTPENDLVRIFCKEGSAEHGKFFDFFDCKDDKCRYFKKCPLKGIPKEAENWIYKDDLFEILNIQNISIDKKYIEYQNADYETVMYFYNNNFKGEVAEKKAMLQVLSLKDVEVFLGNDAEIKDTFKKEGFLTPLLNVEEDEEIVSFVKYVPDQIEKDISKCIKNAKKKNEFKLKCISEKIITTESDCYDILKDFYKIHFNVEDFPSAKKNIINDVAKFGKTGLAP